MSERLPALRFEVPGIPVTQGATNPAQVTDHQGLMVWRNSIAVVARGARRGRWPAVMAPECVSVFATFRLPATKTGMWAGMPLPGGSKDLDKLQRALGDAMQTAGVYRDDAQIVNWVASKRWAETGHPAGVEVVVIRAGAPISIPVVHLGDRELETAALEALVRWARETHPGDDTRQRQELLRLAVELADRRSAS